MGNSSVDKILFDIFDKVINLLPDQAQEELSVKIAVIGVTGVGKTTTCNALLGTTWKTSHTEATTRELQVKQLILDENGKEIPTNVYITDFPGLGESLSRDQEYLSLYRTYLIFTSVTEITKGFDEIKAFILKSLLCNSSKKDTKWVL
ncbi:GTPase [Geminocystis sp. GBBB08]|uniref:GTPase n=1 Tax=Geminocystis sp. GBBB08 TaxID=2604140 RepID=UPI0027E392D2|nr:GTPase [Geminocystis sp. GBBB08]MBL1209151.1 hypothetical protein [Geminocystis sp. GBBB08]